MSAEVLRGAGVGLCGEGLWGGGCKSEWVVVRFAGSCGRALVLVASVGFMVVLVASGGWLVCARVWCPLVRGCPLSRGVEEEKAREMR